MAKRTVTNCTASPKTASSPKVALGQKSASREFSSIPNQSTKPKRPPTQQRHWANACCRYEGASEITVYDGWNVLAEIGDSGTKYYTWGRDLSGTPQGAGGVGGLLATRQPETNNQEPTTNYFHYDGNGNVIQLTNSDGGIVATYEYDSFGNLIHQSGPEADNNSWRFSTKYFDSETGFYYYGMRYLDTDNGRWISRDPIEELGGANVYLFVRNRSTDHVDPYGLYDDPQDTSEMTLEELELPNHSGLYDFEALLVLHAAEPLAWSLGRKTTSSILGHYLRGDGEDYTLTEDQVLQIITDDSFNAKMIRDIATIVDDHGVAEDNWSYSDTDFQWRHTFTPGESPDLYGAFHNIYYRFELEGCLRRLEGTKWHFEGNFNIIFQDDYNFSNPEKRNRTPFAVLVLPYRYSHFREGRFLRLENRGWVDPFRVKGERRPVAYDIMVDTSNRSGTARYDPYDR